ncbi:MAG: galactokinase [Gemmatimonadaceae bacterium]
MIRRRTIAEIRDGPDAGWFAPGLDLLTRSRRSEFGVFFTPGEPLTIARAPARLDVMGGIADYSGSLVLQLPLDRSTFAIAQRQARRALDIVSLRAGHPHRFQIDVDALMSGSLADPDVLASWFAAREQDRWAAYVVGVYLATLTQLPPAGRRSVSGLRLLIDSQVPEGKGISSSAALEVACMLAIAACLGIDPGAEESAALCQWAENRVAGAPCGIMDQMTAACGREDHLLRLLCQPATVEGHVTIPDGYRFYGIDSGLRHAVTGASYGTVRAAAFMGARMIAAMGGDRWHGYLANVAPDEFSTRFEARLPERMSGAEFLANHHGITDSVTRVTTDQVYPVREATKHPVYEHVRVRRFAELLERLPEEPALATELGHLMYASHESYSACGLGSEGTDRLVSLVRQSGAGSGLFGARITGGGSGGTVAIFGTTEAETTLREVAARYAEETGRTADVFSGSGPGADQTGVGIGAI